MRWPLVLVFASSASLVFGQLGSGQPPIPPKRPKTTELHGKTLVDNYFWLREKENPEVIAHLKAENRYDAEVMKPTVGLQKKLYKEIVSRIKEDDQDAPVYDRGYWYYSRLVKGKEYPIVCRKKGSLNSKEQILLDCNTLAKGKPYFDLGLTEVSPDGRILAYSTDTTGYREYQLEFKNLATGKNLPDKPGKVDQVTWAANSSTYYTVTEDAAKRSDKVHRRTLGSDDDEVVADEKDEVYSIGISESSDRKRLFIESYSKDTSEAWHLSLDDPKATPKMVYGRMGTRKRSIDSRGGWFYMVTNDMGPNNRLVKGKVEAEPREWVQVIPHRKSVVLAGVSLFKDFMVLSTREGGFQKLSYRPYEAARVQYVPQADPVATIGLQSNPDKDRPTFRYYYASMTTPGVISDFSPSTKTNKVVKRNEVRGGFRSSDYVSELVWATARDGVKVPISIVRKRTTKKSSSTHLYLTAYGSYGAPSDPYFSISRLSLLNRGVIFATAHIRGGGEFGEAWYLAGKMKTKMNTFTDFIDCGNWLVKNGWTSHKNMAINGGSAGGLLMGAVVNLSPGLAANVLADVPFVDVINTMLDETIPLTVQEFIEWGNPKKPEEYEWMAAYSPYDNVKPRKYPTMLINISYNDSQVPYWEGAKWAAKLRENNLAKTKIIVKVNMDAGHGGASGRYSSIKETAHDYAFLLTQWGLK